MASTTTNGETAAAKTKLHGRAFYESIGSPKYVIAPMVDQSEFAWRTLTRSFLTPAENAKLLAYTPMFHARLFEETAKYRDSHFQATRPELHPNPADPSGVSLKAVPFLDGNPKIDRPLFVQFCANDPDHLLAAAKLVAPYCDAVDLNLGCPQGIARKGHYGAFLQEDQDLIYRLISTLHEKLSIPVTAKIRILETKEDTLAYAKNVLAAGASIITVHGRRREQKGHLTGVADWEYIRYLRENLPKETVIFANGNVLQHEDLERCLETTGADAVMSAEGNLSDPSIFAPPPPPGQEGREYWRGKDGKGGYRVDAIFRRYMDNLYKNILGIKLPDRRPLFVVGDDEAWLVEKKDEEADHEDGPARKKRKKEGGGGGGGGKNENRASGNIVAMRPHLFHLLRHFISKHTDVRDALARCPVGDLPAMEKVLDMVERRVAQGLIEYEKTGGKSVEEPEPEAKPKEEENKAEQADDAEFDPESSVATVKKCKRPWWVAQPIVRPLPKEALAKGSIMLGKKEKKKQEAAAKAAGATPTPTEEKVANGTAAEKTTKPEEELPKPDGVAGVKEPAMDTEKQALAADELVCG